MNKAIIDTLNKIEFFNNDLSNADISSLSDNTFIAQEDNKSFLIKLYNKNNFIESESINEFANILKAINYGYLEEVDSYYQIFDFNGVISLKNYLYTCNNKDVYNIGYEFGKILKDIHSITVKEDFDWYDFCNTKINYLFFMHGISDAIGDRDYILIDYISHNRHLTKSIKTCLLLDKLKLDDIFIDKEHHISFIDFKFKKIGDPFFDFTNINRVALKSPEFARGCMNAYFDGKKAPVKFFRLLSLYQAYLILENIVNTRAGKVGFYSKEEESSLLLMYDNFNQEIPEWI